MKRLLQISTLLCGTLVFAGTQSAQSQPGTLQNDFSLGLQNLRWGMSVADVKTAIPELMFSSQLYGVPSSVTNPAIATEEYSYGGCQFWLAAYFYSDRLDRLSLNSESATADCRREIIDQLNAGFGTAARRLTYAAGSIGTTGALRGQTTSVLYSHSYSIVDVQFEPNDDISGRRVAEEPYSKCERIEAFVETGASAYSEPTRVLADPGLGCEYPQISERLQEIGVVRLSVHVRRDGSGQMATILAPSRSMRLNDTALRIASARLRFAPAIQSNGETTESDVKIRLVFTIIHPYAIIIPCRRDVPPPPPPFQPVFACI